MPVWRQGDNPYIQALGSDRGLAALWMLDEASGTSALRAAGPAGSCVYSAAGITYRVAGPTRAIPWAISTTAASNGHILLPDLSSYLGSSQPQAWSIWVNRAADTDSTTAQRAIFGSDDDDDSPILFGAASSNITNEVAHVRTDVLAAGVQDTTGWTGFTITAGWHHHLVSFTGTQDGWFYYLDGRPSGTKASFSGGSPGMPIASTYYIARHVAGYTSLTYAAPAVFNRYLDADDARAMVLAAHGLLGRPRSRVHA